MSTSERPGMPRGSLEVVSGGLRIGHPASVFHWTPNWGQSPRGANEEEARNPPGREGPVQFPAEGGGSPPALVGRGIRCPLPRARSHGGHPGWLEGGLSGCG